MSKNIAVIGLPNTGKSQVFNNLTGNYSIVANYPLTTIELKRAECKIDDSTYTVIDTPGLNSLYSSSEEGIIVRDLLLSNEIDIIIQCIDANQLKQSLLLTADLAELGIPMVISLNAVDETARQGVWIDSKELSKLLGIPVIEHITISKIGVNRLKNSIKLASIIGYKFDYGDMIERAIVQIKDVIDVDYVRKIALLLFLKDNYILEFVQNKYDDKDVNAVKSIVSELFKDFSRRSVSNVIISKHNAWIDEITAAVVKRQIAYESGIMVKLAALSRNIITGIPIMLGIITLFYLLIVNVANVIAGWMEDYMWMPVYNTINKYIPGGFWNEFLIGDYGVLSLGLANAFITVLPILSVFFLLYSVLEDVGYIPNLSVLTRRLFAKFGLSGTAIMPLVLGFGCKTMATLTTKSLRSKKERYIAIFLIGIAIPCASQLGLNMSILGRMGITAFLIAFSMLSFIGLCSGLLLNRLIKEDIRDCYIQELPNMRVPRITTIFKKTSYRLYDFLREATPVFVLAALGLFLFDKAGILGGIKILLEPLFSGLLGLPVSMVEATLLLLARHEAAAAFIINLIEDGQMNYIQCIVAVIFTTTFVPCIANIGAMIKELGVKTAIPTVLTINAISLCAAASLNWILIIVL